MKNNPLASLRAKVAVVGVMALGTFTGAAYANALPAPVQHSVSDVASNFGLSVPSEELPSIAPLETTPTTTPDESNVDNGTQNHKNDGTQNDGPNSNVDNGTQNDGAQTNVDDGAKNDKDDGAQNDGAHDNVDQGQQGNVDQGQQGNADQGNQGDGNQGDGNQGDGGNG
ncbi:MAG: hypothetical protein M3R37_05490 [Actinomycetota bacterium]|nr:hypothetical protein [Actinomycetota bacterium]